LPAAILHELGVRRVRLLSNNPHKSRALSAAGIEVVTRVPCEAAPTPDSLSYLRTKKERMGHALTLGRSEYTWAPTESHDEFEFASIETAIRELKAGRMVVVVDDEDRENEGDLTMAAELVTPEAINFMATHGRGLICLAMTGERLDELDLAPMVSDNTAPHGTAFTVSIDLIGPGANDPVRGGREQLSGRLRPAGARLPAACPPRRGPGAPRPDGGGRRSRRPCGAISRRRHLRNHQ
jgi:hypothetical protein